MPIAEQGEYVAVPSTPFASALDPRAEELQLELPFEFDDSISDMLLHEVDFDHSEPT